MKNMSQSTPANLRKGGFAVIIALSLMAFVVLLLISMSTLIQVETETANIQKQTLRARQNALLGAYVALGNLQKYAGQDQRVTATGDILSTTHPSRAKLTGVWDSTTGSLTQWLASNANPAVPIDVTTEVDTDNDVLLVSERRSGTPEQVEAIYAEPVDLLGPNGNSSGQYAWWIGDEGVKARINIQDFTRDEDDSDGFTEEDAKNRFLTSQSVGVRYVDPDSNRFDAYDQNQGWVSRIYNTNSLEIQLGDTNLGEDYFHSLSANSRSVLSNTRDGGLRKDLTHIFENNDAFNREFKPTNDRNDWNEEFIFRPDGASDGWFNTGLAVSGAPNWGVLRDYYLSHLNVSNGVYDSTQFNNLLSNGAGISPWRTAYVNDTQESHQTISPVHSVISLLQIGVGLEYVRSNTFRDGTPSSDTVYFPRIHMRPIVGIYNPYDVALEKEIHHVAWSVEPRITLSVGSFSKTLEFKDLIPENSISGTRFRWKFEGSNSGFELQPGETRLFALDDRYQYTSSSFDASMDNDYNAQGSYYINLTRDANIGGSLTDAEKDSFEFTDDGSGIPTIVITIEFFANSGIVWHKIGSGNSADTYQMWQGPFSTGEDPANMPQPITKTFTNPLSSLIADSAGDLTTPTLGTLRIGFRGTQTSQEPFRFLIDGNIRAFDNGVNVDAFNGPPGLSYAGILTGTSFDGELEPEVADFSRYATYWGQGFFTGASPRVTMFHVPRNRLLSLGYLQHANIAKHSSEPTYMVGNGYASIRIPLDETRNAFKTNSWASTENLYFDFSHEINRRLWDGYFLSTIAQDLTAVELNDYLDENKFLPNSRLRFRSLEDYPTLSISNLTDGTNSETPQFIASQLLIEGGFNINSTSVEAWEAIFSSMNNLEIPIYSPTTGDVENFNTIQDAPFLSRTGAPAGRDFWNGYREYSDDEITNFATAMVNEIKQRGPFMSMADFLNRDPNSSITEEQRRSPLQAALDKSLNTNSSPSTDGSGDNFSGLTGIQAEAVPDYESAHNSEDYQGMGFPGWVLQADLLQHLGPILTNRSDTFIIRSKGSSNNTLGSESSEAWVELVVQRQTEPVVESGSNGTVTELIEANNTFGRQFRVVDMRWLTKNEI